MPKVMRVNVGGRRRLVSVAVVVALLVSMPRLAVAQPAATAPLDGRIQELVDAGVLLGTPGGDLQLDRVIQSGEFITMIERVLRTPASSGQRLGTGASGTQSDKWIRAYAWSRMVWQRALQAWARVRQIWFSLRYRRAEDQPWGLARSHWMSAGLRDAYLESGLIDLSFKPMQALGGSEAIDLILAAAGYSGEVAAARAQMSDAAPDEARRIVCYQHNMERLMQYAGRPVTRKDAALMVWLLREQHLGAS